MGHDYIWRYRTNVRWSELFVQLQRDARENDRGLWASTTCDGSP
jgi:endonuclease YncB( thermonuclease family)